MLGVFQVPAICCLGYPMLLILELFIWRYELRMYKTVKMHD